VGTPKRSKKFYSPADTIFEEPPHRKKMVSGMARVLAEGGGGRPFFLPCDPGYLSSTSY